MEDQLSGVNVKGSVKWEKTGNDGKTIRQICKGVALVGSGGDRADEREVELQSLLVLGLSEWPSCAHTPASLCPPLCLLKASILFLPVGILCPSLITFPFVWMHVYVSVCGVCVRVCTLKFVSYISECNLCHES